MNRDKELGLLLACITPLIGCLLLMLSQRVSLSEISLSASQWNDELMYYKQIEGMVDYGVPQGYFGYNESHSVYGNFGGWTPANLIPYFLIGKIFGWNYSTPFIFNIALICLCMVFMNIVLKPTFKQQVGISLAYIAYMSASRYIFSTTPEAFIIAVVLIFVVCFIKFLEEESKVGWLIACDFIMVWLTILRGFYGIFGALILVGLYVKANRKILWKQWLVQIVLMGLALVAFILMTKYFQAPYDFGGDISGDSLFSIKTLIKSGVLGMAEAGKYMVDAVMLKSMRGCWYICYVAVTLWIIIGGISKRDIMRISVGISFVIILASMFTIYNAKEGSRQLMALTVVTLLLMPLYEDRKLVKYAIIGATALLLWLDGEAFFRDLPLDTDGSEQLYVQTQQELSDIIPISANEWDNTLICSRTTYFQDLYAIPTGIGINYCFNDYIKDNFDELSSKYVAVRIGDDIEGFLKSKACEQIYSYNDTAIYQLR